MLKWTVSLFVKKFTFEIEMFFHYYRIMKENFYSLFNIFYE
jgi:hypothetical protein